MMVTEYFKRLNEEPEASLFKVVSSHRKGDGKGNKGPKGMLNKGGWERVQTREDGPRALAKVDGLAKEDRGLCG